MVDVNIEFIHGRNHGFHFLELELEHLFESNHHGNTAEWALLLMTHDWSTEVFFTLRVVPTGLYLAHLKKSALIQENKGYNLTKSIQTSPANRHSLTPRFSNPEPP